MCARRYKTSQAVTHIATIALPLHSSVSPRATAGSSDRQLCSTSATRSAWTFCPGCGERSDEWKGHFFFRRPRHSTCHSYEARRNNPCGVCQSHVLEVDGVMCLWALYEHDKPAFPWASRLARCASGRCSFNDGNAWSIVALCGRHPAGSTARIVLVPHSSSRGELSAGSRWDVRSHCHRRYRPLCS